jgi:acyl-CoA thioesterase I
MCIPRLFLIKVTFALVIFVSMCCFADPEVTTLQMTGESLVLVGQMPGSLCFNNVVPESVIVRSTYKADKPGVIVYEPQRDYVVDPAKGTITRTAESRIPDFQTNMLYGKKDFDHNGFPGFGNGAYFIYVDYADQNGSPLFTKTDQKALLRKTRERLEAGGPFKVIAYGDSITCGGDASEETLQFTRGYALWLQEQFPKAEVIFENAATGGDSTVQGLARLEDKVLSRSPNLVLVGFGMNDHNKGGMEPDAFENNLVQIIETIQTRTGAEVIAYSAFPPNPDWKFGSHRMELFAAATQRAASRIHCAFADVFNVWRKVLQRKDLPSLLGNNINHPNDFGHWLYLETLKSVHF